jgi:hypothetical protein
VAVDTNPEQAVLAVVVIMGQQEQPIQVAVQAVILPEEQAVLVL